ncbi:MAG: ribose 5-phosphate isomerase B [Bacilli bacterium]|nr:ribose 5-phosphate isomerase B [Bacilli bacterium]
MKGKIAIGNDHGGLDYKNRLMKFLKEQGYEVINVGTDSEDSCDYPVYGKKVAELVKNGDAKYGVLICTTGEGISISANKVKGIRCGVAYNPQVAALMRQHNDANVIAFGQKFMDYEMVEKALFVFLNTEFEGGIHQRRVELISDIEK